MISGRLIARQVAHSATRMIAVRWGERIPFYYVCEYPKSGGTWLSQMLADYLRIPFPRHAVLPTARSAVIQNHWRYDPRFRRVAYLFRDGRDVMVSFLFHWLRLSRDPSHPAQWRHKRFLRELSGEDYEEQDTGDLLYRFIECSFREGAGSNLDWRRHVEDWLPPGEERPHVTYLSYEDLLRDTPGTLTRVLKGVTRRPVDRERVVASVERFSMENQTGRRPGEEDRDHAIRKGVSGDWKNHFTPACARLFHSLAGDTLIRLGYEEDAGWVERFEATASS